MEGNKNTKNTFYTKKKQHVGMSKTRSGWYRRKGQVCRTSIKLNKPLPYKPT